MYFLHKLKLVLKNYRTKVDWFEDNKKTKKYIREIIKTWLEKN